MPNILQPEWDGVLLKRNEKGALNPQYRLKCQNCGEMIELMDEWYIFHPNGGPLWCYRHLAKKYEKYERTKEKLKSIM
jgi:hypothetical protein